MRSLFDTYGIKEVADVGFYNTVTGALELYIDTLKVSTLEETASQSAATGGKGNTQLIVWDYGKEITLNLEDALFSMKSMALMHSQNMDDSLRTTTEVDKATRFTAAENGKIPQVVLDEIGEDIASVGIFDEDGKLVAGKLGDKGTALTAEGATGTIEALEAGEGVSDAGIVKDSKYLVSWKKHVESDSKNTIVISAANFPGTYKVVGDTFARNRDTGRDEFFQFVIPLAKMTPEKTITMQAEGDPSTFSMSLTVLRPEDGEMVKLIKY